MFRIVYAPGNMAWFIVFGSGSITECTLLRVFNDKHEAEYVLRQWGKA